MQRRVRRALGGLKDKTQDRQNGRARERSKHPESRTDPQRTAVRPVIRQRSDDALPFARHAIRPRLLADRVRRIPPEDVGRRGELPRDEVFAIRGQHEDLAKALVSHFANEI